MIFFPLVALTTGAAAACAAMSPVFNAPLQLSAAGLPTPSATSPAPACALTCDITTARYGFGISCETGQVFRKGQDSTDLEYGLNLGQVVVVSAIVSVNQTLTYADSKNSYTITGKIQVKPVANSVAYDIRATGGVFGDNAQGCQSGVFDQSAESPTAPPSTMPPTATSSTATGGEMTQTPDLAALAAATIARRQTMTAQAVVSFTPTPTPSLTWTPNQEQTLAAIVAATETANAIVATQQQNTLGTMVAATETALAAPSTETPAPTETPFVAATATPFPATKVATQAAVPANPTPGKWNGTADFGSFVMMVNPNGTGVTHILYTFTGQCGHTGSVGNGQETGWDGAPITSGFFTFAGQTMTLSGSFDVNGTSASGTWVMPGCGSGQWTATPATTPVSSSSPTQPPTQPPTASPASAATEAILFQDDVSNSSNANHWNLWANDGGKVEMSNGSLNIDTLKPNWGSATYPAGSLPSDVDASVTAQAVPSRGDSGCALGVRGRWVAGNNDYSSYYLLWAAGDGSWTFFAFSGYGMYHAIAEGKPSTSLQGGTLKLRIVAVGSHFDLYVNDTQVGQANDMTLSAVDGNKIILFAGTGNTVSNQTCKFTNVVVRQPVLATIIGLSKGSGALPIHLQAVNGEYVLQNGTVAQAGSTLDVKEEWLFFSPGLEIEIGNGGVTLKGEFYPEGSRLLVDPGGNLVERAANAELPTSALPTAVPINKKVFGPKSSTLVHNAESGMVSEYEVTNSLKNLIVEVRFFNPYEVDKIGWDYAIFFRSRGATDQYRLSIYYQKWWGFGYGMDKISEGALPNLNTAVGDSNDLRLVVTGKTARFYVNGVFISTLDVSKFTTAGTTSIVTGAFSGDQITGKSTHYEGFTIWALPDDMTEQTPIPTVAPTQTGQDLGSASAAAEKIVFSSVRQGNSHIYLMDSDGKNIVRLTNGPGEESQPVLSPDGQHIAYYVSKDKGKTKSIYMMNVDGSDQHEIVPPNAVASPGAPAWSPDSKKLVFVFYIDLYTVNIDGSGLKPLGANLAGKSLAGFAPSWSPDGQRLLFIALGSTGPNVLTFSLLVMNANSTQATPFLKEYTQGVWSPQWSPDGRHVAMILPGNAITGVGNGIAISDGSGSGFHSIFDGKTINVLSVTWSPDRSKLVFSGSKSGRTNDLIFVVNTDGSGLQQLSANTADDSYPVWGRIPVDLLPKATSTPTLTPTKTLVPTRTPIPSRTPIPTRTPKSTATPIPSQTPKP